jgi:hypothetical protein
MSEIQPGDGWRLLTAGEELRHGDELLTSRGWLVIPSIFIGERVNDGHRDLSTFRRRIPAKPERLVLKEVAASICHRKKKPETWKVVASIDATFPGTGYVDAAEARQLADWLTRYADWREAQGATGNGSD